MNPPTQHSASPAADAVTHASDTERVADRHPVKATVLLPAWEDDGGPRYRWSTRLRADGAAGANARLRVRPRLTVARWRGDVDLAARIADFLVDHAVKRGRAFADGCVVLRLTVDAADGLLIEVDDADPELPSATRAGHGHGVRLSWQGKQDGNTVVGKTVSARLTAPDLAGESA